jgi:hypothetical protein
LTRGLSLAAVLCSPILVTGIAAAFLRTAWAGPIMLVSVVVSVVLASQLAPGSRYGMVAAGVAAGMSAILTLIWAPLAVLDVHGEQVTAVVSGERVNHGRHNQYRYSLHRSDGRPIPGELIEYADNYAIGDRVDVVVDRRKDVDPVDAGALQDERMTGIAAAGCLMLAGVLAVMIGRRHTWSLSFRFGYRPRH